MANGIANKRPSGQNEKSNVCVSRFAKTPTRGIEGFSGLSVRDALKNQIKNGEYIAIKISDRPLQIEKEGFTH